MQHNKGESILVEYTNSTNRLYEYINKNKLKKKNFDFIDKTNRDEVINSMLPMVCSMVKTKLKSVTIYKNTCNLEDLINVGVIGLVKGVDLYIEKNLREKYPSVTVYCYYWIEKYIKEYLMSFNCDVKKLVNSYENKNNTYNVSDIKIVVEDISEDGVIKTNVVDSSKNDEYSEDVKIMVDRLFKDVTMLQKKIIFLYFGIGVEKQISLVNIASMFKITYKKCTHEYESGLATLKKNKDFCKQILDLKDLIKFS